MHKGPLGVHQVELVIQTGEHFRNARRVGDHAHCPLHFGQVPAGNYCRGLTTWGFLLYMENAFRVEYQSTNWMVRLVLIVATDALTSLGTTSPRYIMQQAMYLP